MCPDARPSPKRTRRRRTMQRSMVMNKNRPSLLPLSPLLLLLLLLLLPSPTIVHAASSRLREQKRDDKQLPPSATSGREEVEVDASGVSSSISNTGKLTVKQDEVRQRLLAVDDSEQLVAEWKDHLEKFKGYMDMGAADIEVFKGHRDTQAADVEMFKGYRDIQAAENFTALDFLSLRGFVLSLTPDDTDPTIYPMCELFKIGGPLRLHCIILGITARSFIQRPPSLSAWAKERQALPGGGLGGRKDLLPHELKDVFPVPDYITDEGLIAEEKPVYYWYYRQVTNAYAFALRWDDEGARNDSSLLPMLPEGCGYGNQSVLWVEGPKDIPFRRPMGQTLTYFPPPGQQNQQHQGAASQLLVILRGSMYAEEWITNYRLNHADVEDVRAFGFDPTGRVPKGFFSLFQEIAPQVDEQLARHPEVQYVSIAGHSLGGSLGIYLACYYDKKRPDLKISLVLYGTPNSAEASFFDSNFRETVNVRHLAYVGSGLLRKPQRDPFAYGIGDLICQMPPDCTSVSQCPIAIFRAADGLGDLMDRYKFAGLPGVIPFYATDMPNTAKWLYYEDFAFHPDRMDRGLIVSHMCSYTCFTSSAVPGSESRCYFPEQGPRPEEDVCDLLLSRRANLHHGPLLPEVQQ